MGKKGGRLGVKGRIKRFEKEEEGTQLPISPPSGKSSERK